MSSSPSSGHSLAFRVMRLCRPALQVDIGLRLDPGNFFNASTFCTASACKLFRRKMSSCLGNSWFGGALYLLLAM